jgi:hypothetical protein
MKAKPHNSEIRAKILKASKAYWAKMKGHDLETKVKISKAMKARWTDPEYRQNMLQVMGVQ